MNGPIAVEAKANSNSIAVIKESYEGLDKNTMMQSQPKSEQKFRSQTNDNRKQRIKRELNVIKSGPETATNEAPKPDRIVIKQTVR